MRTHELKTDVVPFQAIVDGRKRYEVRVNDRDYGAGDILVLKEFDRRTEQYSGREVHAQVSYMTAGGMYGLPFDLCVLSIVVLHMVHRSLTPVRMAIDAFDALPTNASSQDVLAAKELVWQKVMACEGLRSALTPDGITRAFRKE